MAVSISAVIFTVFVFLGLAAYDKHIRRKTGNYRLRYITLRSFGNRGPAIERARGFFILTMGLLLLAIDAWAGFPDTSSGTALIVRVVLYPYLIITGLYKAYSNNSLSK